ncbi:MAG: hypothetical protein JST51_16055 [Armatimonadetes bacterium]|nr:hypothetical protein [Armatimonadota bacterium]
MQAERKRKDFTPLIMSAIFVMVFLLCTYAFPDPQQSVTLDQSGNLSQFIIKTSPYAHTADIVFQAVSVVSLVVLIISAVRKNWQGLILLAVMLGTLVILLGPGLDQAGEYEYVAKFTDTKGQEYHLMTSHFLQGSHLILGLLERHTPYETAYKIVGDDTWEDSFLTVVRPKGAPDSYQIYRSPSGLLVGLADSNMCFIAYDPEKKIAFNTNNANTIGSGSGPDVRLLSPFLLLGESDVPSDQDFQALLRATGDNRPSRDAIEKELTNPNPKVREMAAQYLKVVKP